MFIKIVIFYLFGFPLMNFSVMFANFCFGSKSFFANFTETSFLFMPIQMSKIKFLYVSSPSIIHISRIYKFYANVYTYSSMSKKSSLDFHPYSMYVDYRNYKFSVYEHPCVLKSFSLCPSICLETTSFFFILIIIPIHMSKRESLRILHIPYVYKSFMFFHMSKNQVVYLCP